MPTWYCRHRLRVHSHHADHFEHRRRVVAGQRGHHLSRSRKALSQPCRAAEPRSPLPLMRGSSGTPRSGWGPLAVTFTDQSTNAPTSWTWDIQRYRGGTGTGTVSDPAQLSPRVRTLITYNCIGAPGDICTFTVSLRVGNGGGNDTETKTGYITVEGPLRRPVRSPTSRAVRSGVEAGDRRTSSSWTGAPGAPSSTLNFEWDCKSDGNLLQVGPTKTTAVCTYATAGPRMTSRCASRITPM